MKDTSVIPRNGNTRSMVLSSQTTLIWRVFMPVFGTVFLAGFVVLFWLGASLDEYEATTSLWRYRMLFLALLLVWLFVVYRFLWPLKRVEADDAYVYISDYWHTVRYPWQDVVELENAKRFGRTFVRMHLSQPGRFGRVIRFLPSGHYKEWLETRI